MVVFERILFTELVDNHVGYYIRTSWVHLRSKSCEYDKPQARWSQPRAIASPALSRTYHALLGTWTWNGQVAGKRANRRTGTWICGGLATLRGLFAGRWTGLGRRVTKWETEPLSENPSSSHFKNRVILGVWIVCPSSLPDVPWAKLLMAESL